MKIIEPKVELIKPEGYDLNSIYKMIEIGGRTCYSEDTEVLTNKGWVAFKDMTNDYMVLTYDKEYKLMSYEEPNVMSKVIDDNMIEIDHPNIKLKVTKDHRIFQSVPEKRDYSFLTAAQLAGIDKIPKSKQNRFRIPKYFIGSEKTFENIPLLEHSKYINQGSNYKKEDKLVTVTIPCNEDFMVIAGAFISEGHTNHREKYGSGSYCQITQDENSPLYRNVINALNNLGWKYRIHEDPRKPNIKWICFGGGQCFVEYFDILFGKGSENKHLPSFFRYLPNEYLQVLIENLYLGDGSHSTTRKERYLSKSKRLLDEIQEVFILLGKNASYTYDTKISQKCSLEESTRDSWVIHRNKHIKVLPKKLQTVYCTQTNNGVICVRYKGKTCWCGNCYKSDDKITDGSAKKFVEMIKTNSHLSVFEHGTVYLKLEHFSPVIDYDYVVTIETILKYKENKYSKVLDYNHNPITKSYYITTNMRVIIENGWEDDLKYLCEPTEYHEKRYMFRFTTQIAITREANRLWRLNIVMY